MRDYTVIADTWAVAVLDGQVDVGAQVRQAVQRQAADFGRSSDAIEGKDRTGNFPYWFDPEAANKACALAERLHWPKGPKRGKPVRLEPSQVWLLRVFFGWVDVTGLPRWRSAYLEMCKGNGKSPLAAIIGIIKIVRGRATGAKVYCAAMAEKQANNVFEPAQEMLRLSPDVCEAAGLVVGEHSIRGIGDPRVFERVSAEKRSADGTVGDLYIVDETHQHPTRALHDVLVQNASKVEGSCILDITTAGTDQSPDAIGWILHRQARDVLAGRIEDHTAFAFISAADRDRSPWDERTWRQANLNYGVSVSPAGFAAAARAAKADPGGQPHFLATRLGWWQQNARHFVAPEQWEACANPDRVAEMFAAAEGRPITLGLDLAVTRDLSAVVQVATRVRDDGAREYAVRCRSYLPEGSVTLEQLPILRQWAEAGHLILTRGNALLPSADVVPDIRDACAHHPGSEICYDPAKEGRSTAVGLGAEGLLPVEVKTSPSVMTPAMGELESAVLTGRMYHENDPVLAWAIGNLIAVTKGSGLLHPDKETALAKVDPAIALLTALVRAMVVDLADAHGADHYLAVLDGSPSKQESPEEIPGAGQAIWRTVEIGPGLSSEVIRG